MWSFIGRFISTNWIAFLVVSVGWEVLELYLPYDFAIESNINKISDLIVNTIGFWIGIRLRYSTDN
ncbi:MAG: hypothetical protein ISR22_01715 [Candidatus Poseidoniaceae archaeon]|nr:hypothetical protein [Euryarchaeota archaeon]MBL6890752.1 hypothetical protein [Candidatus Poseidoniaceae archaeon]RAH07545.1 MAG: hypothetical protein CBC92_001550 [Euryarchaeota archaeon TMED132]|tara:strand:- start:259 stop:456 length:198 start_codon:yes stop_codon:yes gene_type:complete